MITAYASGASRPYRPMGGVEEHVSRCGTGPSTSLEIRQQVAKIPQHDVDLGKTEVILRAVGDGRVLVRETLRELWECVAYDPRTRKYLIGSKNEHGVKVTLRGLAYLDEQKATFQDTAFGKAGFEAVSAKLSPDNRFLVFIAAPEGEEAWLYSFDLDDDRVRKIAPAPAPPPLPKDQWKDRDARHWLWAWDAPERWYVDLEPEILQFSAPHTVQISYGADTLKGRAARRKVKSFELAP